MVKPLLNEVYLRIGWADEHITTLKKMDRHIEQIDPDTITVHGEFEESINAEGNRVITTPWFDMGEPMYDPLWARELGYATSNLRNALDYFVFALARLDSGTEKKGTQFPICSNPSEFKKCIKRGYLLGVKPAHRAAIELLQPYKGGNWLKDLASLSNSDKHMHLTTVASQNLARNLTFTNDFDAATQIREMKMELHATRFIAFHDNSPVIPLLDTLQTQVADTVNQFEPDF